jgi:hypothetical protein
MDSSIRWEFTDTLLVSNPSNPANVRNTQAFSTGLAQQLVLPGIFFFLPTWVKENKSIKKHRQTKHVSRAMGLNDRFIIKIWGK